MLRVAFFLPFAGGSPHGAAVSLSSGLYVRTGKTAKHIGQAFGMRDGEKGLLQTTLRIFGRNRVKYPP